MSKVAVALMLVVIYGGVVGSVFAASLPGFCANPQGNGNWIVSPLCSK